MKYKRITNPKKIDVDFIKTEVNLGNYVVVQFDGVTYTDEILSELNTLANQLNNNLEIRFYGHREEMFDCKTLLKVNNVKNLSINCLKEVKNLNQLSNLQHIKRLFIGIDNFKESEILNSENLKNLLELSISTEIKTLNLEYLKDYKKLNLLSISGQFKNINSIGEIESLNTLYLSSITKKEHLDFVNELKNLKNLYIGFGSRENIDEVHNENLETLELLWIKNLNSLKNISRFKKLKSLHIENQRNIDKIEFTSEMTSLAQLKIINCKGLEKLEGLENLTALKTLVITRVLKLDFESIINQKLSSTLEHFNFATERKTLDREIKEKLQKLGYKTT